MIFASQTNESAERRYRDTKRYWWILSSLAPAVPGLAALAVAATGNGLWALVPVIFYFVIVPLLDAIFGEDASNPPESAVEELSADAYYRGLLFIAVGVLWFSLVASAWVAGTVSLPWWAFAALALGAGVASGAGLTVGHELGHKPNQLDRFGAKMACALTGYAHFCIEHNRGHHTQVATPEDPASARFNESVWAFSLREIPGAARRGWNLEHKRLAAKGLPFWHWHNDLLQGYFITVTAAIVLLAAFGPSMLLFLAIHHVAGWYQLTFANYVEHYGLLRTKRPDGRYMPCEPRHSWNTNHIVSNLMLFHLQRHSDHHANPLRPYQALRDFEELPRLPSGYPGSFALAFFPPLWFRVMNPKVLAWAGGDKTKINSGPAGK
jgi:alkane 1-monooxygenase